MSKKTKAFIYQLLSFAVLFFTARYLVATFTPLKEIWIPLSAFAVGTILSPKFQAINTRDGEKLFVKWIFLKGVREIK